VIRDVEFCRLTWLAAPLLAAIVLAATGCSGEPTAATTAATQLFSEEELNAMRNSVKTPTEFRALVKIKTAEREGRAVVNTKTSAGKPKR
jgi:hypothetical protein